MKQSIAKRLDALEQAEQARPARNARFTADLLLVYGTPAERAQWEAAGRPRLDPITWKQAFDAAYVVLVPDDAGRLIGPDGQPWKDDGRPLIDLD